MWRSHRCSSCSSTVRGCSHGRKFRCVIHAEKSACVLCCRIGAETQKEVTCSMFCSGFFCDAVFKNACRKLRVQKSEVMWIPIEINGMCKLCRCDAEFHAENARFPHHTPPCEQGLIGAVSCNQSCTRVHHMTRTPFELEINNGVSYWMTASRDLLTVKNEYRSILGKCRITLCSEYAFFAEIAMPF